MGLFKQAGFNNFSAVLAVGADLRSSLALAARLRFTSVSSKAARAARPWRSARLLISLPPRPERLPGACRWPSCAAWKLPKTMPPFARFEALSRLLAAACARPQLLPSNSAFGPAQAVRPKTLRIARPSCQQALCRSAAVAGTSKHGRPARRWRPRGPYKSPQFPVNLNANDANLQALLNLESAFFGPRGLQSDT